MHQYLLQSKNEISYLEHGVVLILPHAVVGMEVNCGFSEPMMLKEVVQHADYCIGSLPCHHSLIY